MAPHHSQNSSNYGESATTASPSPSDSWTRATHPRPRVDDAQDRSQRRAARTGQPGTATIDDESNHSPKTKPSPPTRSLRRLAAEVNPQPPTQTIRARVHSGNSAVACQGPSVLAPQCLRVTAGGVDRPQVEGGGCRIELDGDLS